MSIVRDPEHSDGAPTIEGTGIRVKDIAVAYETAGTNPTRSHSCIRTSRSVTSIVCLRTTTTTSTTSDPPSLLRHEATIL